MIQQLFATMNETLDDLILRYPLASNEEKLGLQEQWNVLKTLSDDIIESWLQFEDKMAFCRELQEQTNNASYDARHNLDPFIKGQGYFKLHMFPQSSEQFEQVVALFPDFPGARLFLAMCRMHMKQWDEAQKHFQLIAATAEDAKLQAIAYNALGCIQAVFAHLEQAQCYFKRALEADPSFGDPQRNLESCQRGVGQLQLQFGSAALQTIVKT